MKEKKETKKTLIDKELIDQLRIYKGLTGRKINETIEILIKDFLKDKLLTNDCIKLNRPYYFKKDSLFKNRETTATTKEPYNNFNNWITLNEIPNNLDSWNIKYNSFCFNNNRSEHRGINQYLTIKEDDNRELKVMPIYLIFIYDLVAFEPQNSLKIAMLSSDDLLNSVYYKNEEYREILNKFIENTFTFKGKLEEFIKMFDFDKNSYIDDKTIFNPYLRAYNNLTDEQMNNIFEIPYNNSKILGQPFEILTETDKNKIIRWIIP